MSQARRLAPALRWSRRYRREHDAFVRREAVASGVRGTRRALVALVWENRPAHSAVLIRMERELELEQVQAEIRACRACVERGYPVTPPPVVGLGTRARILLVGQAPGGMENESRLPFSGPAGKRLFAWLERAGFAPERIREEIYFAALTRCYPGKDARGSGDRRPSREEMALCAPFLGREFALIDPKLILLVGQMAIERFLGKMPLSQSVGAEFEEGDRFYIPLPHPSGASTWLNAPENRDRLEHALSLIRYHRTALIPSGT